MANKYTTYISFTMLVVILECVEFLQPSQVVKSILPKCNRFVWFEVTEASHHQVSEHTIFMALWEGMAVYASEGTA